MAKKCVSGYAKQSIARIIDLVISFEAPTTSPFTPPKSLFEMNRRATGQATMAIALIARDSWGTGRNTSGMQSIKARKGKYGREYF